MTCQEYLSRHSEFMDGRLSVADAEPMHVHAGACGSCARYDRVVRKSVSLLVDLPAVTPSSDFHDRLQHRLLHLQDEMARHDRFSGSGALASLAIAAVIALIAWGPLLVPGAPGASADVAVAVVEPAAEQAPPDAVPVGGWYSPAPGTPVLEGSALMSAAFPGPYSPLIVEEPVTRASRRAARAVFAGYFPALE